MKFFHCAVSRYLALLKKEHERLPFTTFIKLHLVRFWNTTTDIRKLTHIVKNVIFNNVKTPPLNNHESTLN